MPTVTWKGKARQGYFRLCMLGPGRNVVPDDVWAEVMAVDSRQRACGERGQVTLDIENGLLLVGDQEPQTEPPLGLGALKHAAAKDLIASTETIEDLLTLKDQEQARAPTRKTIMKAIAIRLADLEGLTEVTP